MGVKTTGLRYVTDITTFSIYSLAIDGLDVMDVLIDNSDPELRIRIAKPGAAMAHLVGGEPDTSIVTGGSAVKQTYEIGGTPDTPGELQTRISGISVQTYVYPRALILMAKLYGVPSAVLD